MTPEPDKLFDDLSAYLDGELDTDRMRDAAARLSASDEARRTLDELRGVSARLAALSRERVPVNLTETMRQHAERRLLFEARPAPPNVWRMRRLLAQLTAAAAVIVAGVYVGFQFFDKPDELTPVAHLGEGRANEQPVDEDVVVAGARGREAETGDTVVATGADGDESWELVYAPPAWDAAQIHVRRFEAPPPPVAYDESGVMVVNAPAAAAPEAPPSIVVWIHPDDAVAYASTADMLVSRQGPWQTGERVADDRPRLVSQVYSVAAEDWTVEMGALQQLALGASVSNRVQVQMNFDSRDSDLLLAGIVNAAQQAGVRRYGYQREGIFGVPLADVRQGWESASAPDEAPTDTTALPAAAGGRGAAEKPPSPPSEDPAAPRARADEPAAAPVGGAARGGRAGGAAPARDKHRDTPLAPGAPPPVDRLTERHRAATADPADELTIVYVPADDATGAKPSDQAGADAAKALRPASQPTAASRPMSAVFGADLYDLLMRGLPWSTPRAQAQSGQRTVTFRVMLLPPNPAQVPTTTLTSQSAPAADSPDD